MCARVCVCLCAMQGNCVLALERLHMCGPPTSPLQDDHVSKLTRHLYRLATLCRLNHLALHSPALTHATLFQLAGCEPLRHSLRVLDLSGCSGLVWPAQGVEASCWTRMLLRLDNLMFLDVTHTGTGTHIRIEMPRYAHVQRTCIRKLR